MEIKIIERKLKKLNTETAAQFGIMSSQHMIEHLTVTVKIAYNRIKIPDFEPSEKQRFQKRALLDTDMAFPQGVVAPGLETGDLIHLRSVDVEEAKKQLLASISAYNTFFEAASNISTVHPRFGKLNYSEWERFHHKHFEHHFKQFGIW